MKLRKPLLSVAVASLGLLLATSIALAASGYTLFGDAQYVSPGNASSRAVQLRSSGSVAPGYGGIDFAIPAGTTFADLHSLSTDYMFTAASCGGGSPRFVISLTSGSTSGDMSVYIGPPPNYTLCPPNVWTNTGNLLAGVNPIDTTHLPGGAFYDPYAAALTKYGSYTVTDLQIVVDASWFFPGGVQTVQVDNTNVNGTVYTYEPNVPTSKDQCKDGGWRNLEDANGQPFKNQGDCVSYFNHHS